jgi:D-lactate dehydrogenase (cytochrome)
MDLVDLFIGSEGTLGLIVEATLRVVPKPRRAVALVTCASDAEAVSLTGALRAEAQRSWRGEGPLDVSAIEYMDYRALAAVPDEAFSKAGVTRPLGTQAMLLVQVEVSVASGFSRKSTEDASLVRLAEIFDECGVATDPQITLPDDERGAARLFALREAVPTSVNAQVALAKAEAHPDIEKTAGDLIVPFERLGDSLALYRECFERYDVSYAIWGHVSDGNLHPNVVPRSLADVDRGRQAILEMATEVIAMGGAPLAEHGVGRSALKQRLLRDLYAERGIEEMRAVKRALDPEWKFSAGVLFPP